MKGREKGCEQRKKGVVLWWTRSCGGFGFFEGLDGLHDVAAELGKDLVKSIASCPACLGL